ncbi:hypothetical protein R1sor_002567 [Riccia sorocarpa]|uniref:DUF659 domain-containing protein n=1 Tax=Riccia sorocarpa TaxID=122646 RepID=A0ABD3H2C1_9MARC
METLAHRREGSNKHIKGCERASERFKLEIRELNTRQRARATELALLPELASSSRALDEEEQKIESALPRSIIKEEPIQEGRLPSARATEIRPQQSNFSSPSSVANADTPSNNNVQGSQSFPRHAATSTQRRTVQLSIKPMMDAAQREKADKLWSMAQAVMGLPFRTFKHPTFEAAYRFSSQFPGYKLPSEKRLRTTLLDANYETVREESEKNMFNHMVWDKITISCDGWTNRNGRPQMNMLHISRHGELAHRHVDGSNETKSTVWIAEHIIQDIEERGPPNVLQFVADNASANILAGKLVRERYPHIIFGGCVAHGLDLLMEDIGKLPHRWNGWTNIIHTTAMLLNPAYLFDEKRQEFSYHSFIMRDFQEYVTLFAKEVLKYSGEELVQYLHDVDKELEDDVLQENGPEIALSNGEKVRVKTWDWTEPVSAEEVLEDTLQARTMRNAPVDGKLPVGSTEPTENIVYYDDLADHDFPDDTVMSLDDSAVLPGMEVRDEDTLDAYFDVTSEVLPIEAIRNYTIVDDIDKTKAKTLGVGEERLNQLNSRFGVQHFPHVTLNVLEVTLTTKKTRILQEIYSMLGRRTDSFDQENSRKQPKHSSSRLKPTERAGTSQQWENVVGPDKENSTVWPKIEEAARHQKVSQLKEIVNEDNSLNINLITPRKELQGSDLTSWDAIKEWLSLISTTDDALHRSPGWTWKEGSEVGSSWHNENRFWSSLIWQEAVSFEYLNRTWECTDSNDVWKRRWKLLWGGSSLLKHKVWVWRLIHEGLPTSKRAEKWGVSDGRCQICNEGQETVEHVVWGCRGIVDRVSWFTKLLVGPFPAQIRFLELIDRILTLHDNSPGILMLFYECSWTSWKERNRVVFDGRTHRLSIRHIVEEWKWQIIGVVKNLEGRRGKIVKFNSEILLFQVAEAVELAEACQRAVDRVRAEAAGIISSVEGGATLELQCSSYSSQPSSQTSYPSTSEDSASQEPTSESTGSW